jgi:hypothetical protein
VIRRAAKAHIRPPEEDTTIRFELVDVVLPADEIKGAVLAARRRKRAYMDGRRTFRQLAGELFRARYAVARGRRAAADDATISRFLNQRSGPLRHWHEILGHIGSRKTATLEELVDGYRVPREILEYAAPLLATVAPDVTPARGIRETDQLWIAESDDDLGAWTASVAAELRESEAGTIGIIAARSSLTAVRAGLRDESLQFGEARRGLSKRITLLAADEAKGLEFDHVIVVEPVAIANEEPHGLGKLYVALTRPTRSLTVVHSRLLPNVLDG